MVCERIQRGNQRGFASEVRTKAEHFFEERKRVRNLERNQVENGGGERIRTAASRQKTQKQGVIPRVEKAWISGLFRFGLVTE
jgi:hypothetical protein